VSYQNSRPYNITGTIIFLYILIFKFLVSKVKNKIFYTEWQQAFPDCNLLFIPSWIEFWFVNVFSKYLNSPALSKGLLSFFILWLRPAFWSRDLTMYLVLAASASSSIATLFSFTIHIP
jgi:hypothetical protein